MEEVLDQAASHDVEEVLDEAARQDVEEVLNEPARQDVFLTVVRRHREVIRNVEVTETVRDVEERICTRRRQEERGVRQEQMYYQQRREVVYHEVYRQDRATTEQAWTSVLTRFHQSRGTSIVTAPSISITPLITPTPLHPSSLTVPPRQLLLTNNTPSRSSPTRIHRNPVCLTDSSGNPLPSSEEQRYYHAALDRHLPFPQWVGEDEISAAVQATARDSLRGVQGKGRRRKGRKEVDKKIVGPVGTVHRI